MAAGRLRQFSLLMWKNWLFSLRSWKSTLLQLFAPCFFLLLATGLSYIPSGIPNIPNPSADQVGLLPKCTAWNHKNCTSLAVIYPEQPFLPYLPVDTSCVENLIKDFSNVTGLKIGTDIKTIKIPFDPAKINATEEELIKQFASNATQVGLLFLGCNTTFLTPNLKYIILYNSSRVIQLAQLVEGSPNKPDGRVELALLLDQLFMSRVTGKTVNISVNVSTFPRFYQQPSRASRLAAGATIFIYCAITIQFVMLLYNVVSEKDLKLRQGLKLIGLKDSVYWFSWALTGIIIAFLSTCVLMATGYACQLEFFFNTNFFINFFLFLVYSISMVPLAFVASVFIGTVKAAVNCGMVVFVVGMMVISLLTNPFLQVQLYENIKPLVLVLSFLPPFHLAKAMSDIGAASSDTDMNGLPQVSFHFGWHELFQKREVLVFDLSFGSGSNSSSHNFDMPPTFYSFGGLLWTAILYGVLSWYLDAVLKGNHGIPRKLYFCFLPSYWLDWIPYYSSRIQIAPHSRRGSSDLVQVSDRQAKKRDGEGEKEEDGEEGSVDSEGSNEASALLRNGRLYGSQNGQALRIHQLKKTFPGDCCSCTKKEVKPAVDGLSMCAEEHQVLALLGHNGAGKTTTINMLIGLLQPDMGDAYFYNLSVCDNLDAVRSILGVCPQHDVLWGDLTALEHMRLFANLKDIPKAVMEEEIATLLANVELDKVANNYVKTYSGGMKRRLSVALSFLGNPRIMFLDEPTTGMDPKIRRHIWNLILRMKRNRVIIMTTHSMEEADILGDNIAIMANGQLKVMGTSVNLKNRFAGYKVEVIVNHNNIQQMMDLVEEKLPGAVQTSEPIEIEEGGVLMSYSLPPDRQEEVVPFFEVLEKDEAMADLVVDYSISQTTLEEVFLNVTVNELFKDITYTPALMRAHSYTAAVSPTDRPTPFPGHTPSSIHTET